MNLKLFILTLLSIVFIVIESCAQFKQEVKNVAIFVYQGVELFDFAGPGEVFVAAGRQSQVINFNVYTVAATAEEVVSQTFLKVIPNYTIANCPPPDIIVLPGGATNIPLKNPKIIDWIREANKESEITLSVCTGAFLLVKAGLLENLKATTHWGSIDALRKSYPNTVVLEETKFVDNGKIITSGGVSSGIEGSLHVVSRLAGQPTTERVARYMEYGKWNTRIGVVENESEFIVSVKKEGFEKAISTNSSNQIFYGELLNLGNQYLEKENTKEAVTIFEYLVKEFPVAETYEHLGKARKLMGMSVPPTESDLIELFESGQVDKATDLYKQTRIDYKAWIMFSESRINRLGYQLMNAERYSIAIGAFTLNTLEFSDSFNVWDSLAEAYLKSGDSKLAKKYYKKSLELNPENSNARDVLASLE